MDNNKAINIGTIGLLVPKTFDQLGILVLDGSASMQNRKSIKEISLAQEVSVAVRDTFTAFKSKFHKKNYSFSVVYYDNTAKVELPKTEVDDLDDIRSYDPTVGLGGKTSSVSEGLREAQKLAEEHLKGQTSGGVLKSVIIFIISGSSIIFEPEAEAIANQLKQTPNILLTACFFETLDNDNDRKVDYFFQSICSTPYHYDRVYSSEKIVNVLQRHYEIS